MKMNKSIKKFNIVLFTSFILLMMPFLYPVNIKAATVQAIIPIELYVFDNEGKEQVSYEDEYFTLMLIGNNKNTPMPSGSDGDTYYKNIMPGTDEVILTFAEAGDYRYTISMSDKEGFTGASVYEVIVRIAPDGYAQVAAFNETGNKCEISFEMIGKKGQPDAPSSDDKVKEFVDATEAAEVKEPEKTEVIKPDTVESRQPVIKKDDIVIKEPEQSFRKEAAQTNNVNMPVSTDNGDEVKEEYKSSVQAGYSAPATGDKNFLLLYYLLAAAAGAGIAAAIALKSNKYL